MSNFLGVATVTATLSQVLQAAVQSDVPGATVKTLRPDGLADLTQEKGINVYLYRVSPNAAWRNADLPTRRVDGTLAQRPQSALDLHYLLSFFGDEAQLEPQRLLGSALTALHAQPILARERIRQTISNQVFSYLGDSDLADQVELVRFTPVPLSLEELSKLWSAFYQIPYALSTAYQASVVLLEAEATPQPALPVRTPQVTATPQLLIPIEPAAARPTLVTAGVENVQGTGNAPRSATVKLQVDPSVGKSQRATLLLNELSGAVPSAYTFNAPARAAETNTLAIPVTGIKPAEYLVRLQVDGVESLLEVDTNPSSPTFNQYIGPKVNLP
ncbi:MAG TPA: DUF4255 domain-containing protein [Anaerolineae bacterium]|nr:DUF4255 domain-containing protein [Anaerolineae bacterium]